jgi:hypothetical protein
MLYQDDGYEFVRVLLLSAITWLLSSNLPGILMQFLMTTNSLTKNIHTPCLILNNDLADTSGRVV